MKIISFNVNGLRSFSESICKKENGFKTKIDKLKDNDCENNETYNSNPKDFNQFLLDLKADIYCFQEIKGSRSNLSKFFTLKDFSTFASFHEKNGRHGVATIVKKSFFCSNSTEIISGRILKTEHGNFNLYNCYLPYSATDDCDLIENTIMPVYNALSKSVSKQRTIIVGDINATYNLLDSYLYKNEYLRLYDLERYENVDIIDDTIDDIVDDTIDSDAIIGSDKIDAIIGSDKIDVIIGSDKIDYLVNTKFIKTKNHSKKFEKDFFQKLKNLAGDSDVLDKINPKNTELPFYFLTKKALLDFYFRIPQRKWFKEFTKDFVDSFRIFNSELDQYTCWDQKISVNGKKMREMNLGTRIDYILHSKDIECIDASILPFIKGSDHCPVAAEYLIDNYEGEEKNLVKRKNNLLDFFVKK